MAAILGFRLCWVFGQSVFIRAVLVFLGSTPWSKCLVCRLWSNRNSVVNNYSASHADPAPVEPAHGPGLVSWAPARARSSCRQGPRPPGGRVPSCDKPAGRRRVRACLPSSGVQCGGPGGVPPGAVRGSPQGPWEQARAERLLAFGPSSRDGRVEEEQQPWLRVGQRQSRSFPVSAVCQSCLRKPRGCLCVRQMPYLMSYSGLRVGRDDVVSFLQQ